MDQFNIFATSCSNQRYFYLERYISLWVSSMSTIIATYPSYKCTCTWTLYHIYLMKNKSYNSDTVKYYITR